MEQPTHKYMTKIVRATTTNFRGSRCIFKLYVVIAEKKSGFVRFFTGHLSVA